MRQHDYFHEGDVGPCGHTARDWDGLRAKEGPLSKDSSNQVGIKAGLVSQF